MIPRPIVIDFETDAIVGNPIINPPRPCGVAIWIPGQEPEYLAWGHPAENNCSLSEAVERLSQIEAGGEPLLFHNAGFDLSVWTSYLGPVLFRRNPRRIHDTMYLLFMADPYAATLSLKPSADRYLGMAATEQDDLVRWILNNVPEATKKTAGTYISRAPGSLVARYAIGDVVRTGKLFDLLYAKIEAEGMLGAYEREQKLFPIIWEGTKKGIRIDREKLDLDEAMYTADLLTADNMLAQKLNCDTSALDNDEALADALQASGAVEEFVLTPTGKRSMSKDNLKIVIPEVKMLMDYRGSLATCLQTFMRPWLQFSEKDGRLHPNWNQVKQYREGGNWNDKKGTQTGRLSSDSPNFQNVPSEFVTKTGDPLPTPEGLHPLPVMRRYCLPEPGHVWLKRDFSSQEIRILAHFEDGSLCEAYRKTPNLDPHQMAREMIHAMIGVEYARKSIKITGFSLIYGTGVTGLSIQLNQPYNDAFQIKNAYLAAMPGVKKLMDGCQARGKSGQPIRTWGGRIYYKEPSKVVKKRTMDFSYKLLNYLIQGSAADQTKQSIIDWDEMRYEDDVFLATVHDEINISAPEEHATKSMEILRNSMNADRFDVPMLSEGFAGDNWADISECA